MRGLKDLWLEQVLVLKRIWKDGRFEPQHVSGDTHPRRLPLPLPLPSIQIYTGGYFSIPYLSRVYGCLQDLLETPLISFPGETHLSGEHEKYKYNLFVLQSVS